MSGLTVTKTSDIDDSALNKSSAINFLPSEILCKFFLDYLPEGGSEVLVGSLSGTTITLSHVCSRWREVTLGAPRLWSQLSLNLNNESWQEKHSWDQVVQFVLDWFSKAGECPLKLRFGYQPKSVDGRKITEEGYLTRFMSPLMARIQDLELDVYRLPRHLSVLPPNKFLQLESIVLHNGYLQKTNSTEMMWDPDDEPLAIFENTPRLRRLSMFFPLFGKRLDSVLIPWFQITYLITLSYVQPPILDELLSQCVNLVYGVFYIVGNADCSLIPSRPKTTLAHLVELTMISYTTTQPVLAPAVLRNFHLPKLQTLRLGPLNLDTRSLEDKVYLFPHLSLIRRLSFQSHLCWGSVDSDHSLVIELFKFAGNVEDFDISSTNDYSTIMKALIISDGVDIILPKLKSIYIHFEDPFNVDQLRKFSVANLIKMVDSRWHSQQATQLEEISVFLTLSSVTKSLVRMLKKSLEDALIGYIAEGLILHVVVSGVGEVVWHDRLPHDKNYWKEGMDCMRLLEAT
ncbi:hypothetical protein K443DRAFT_678468 [Laccaria amethystina LaAM-08-1]|uniref:F-box domain-containing protein n=1 Tax=Laccaria amethystina LaAM-08-1 TaxID=1095629 RepID=A0A0C9X8D8_9AGAR|nr:hypothetical protein K443DRAFT_678468 [Laccaria amethystina LaAM-08-1]